MQPSQWQLVPIYRVHGSEELSAVTEEISELAGEAFIALGAVVAEKLGVGEGDGVIVSHFGDDQSLEVKILTRVAKNCIGYSAGYAQTLDFRVGSFATLAKDPQWQRRTPQLIATDGGNKRPPNDWQESLHV